MRDSTRYAFHVDKAKEKDILLKTKTGKEGNGRSLDFQKVLYII